MKLHVDANIYFTGKILALDYVAIISIACPGMRVENDVKLKKKENVCVLSVTMLDLFILEKLVL